MHNPDFRARLDRIAHTMLDGVGTILDIIERRGAPAGPLTPAVARVWRWANDQFGLWRQCGKPACRRAQALPRRAARLPHASRAGAAAGRAQPRPHPAARSARQRRRPGNNGQRPGNWRSWRPGCARAGFQDAPSRSASRPHRRRRGGRRACRRVAVSAGRQACLPGRSAERLAIEDGQPRRAAAGAALSARADLYRHPGGRQISRPAGQRGGRRSRQDRRRRADRGPGPRAHLGPDAARCFSGA